MQKFSFKALSDGAKTLAGSRDFRYGVFGVIILVAISLAFFATSLGDTLQQSDTMQGVANGQEAKAYFEQTGEKTCWTNSLFGGMPTFQISPSYASSKFISALQSVFGLGLPSPANLVFMMMAGFYILVSRSEKLDYAREHLNEMFGKKYPKNFRKEHVSYHKDQPDELAVINYTSGTTSYSKGVMLPYRSLWSNTTFAFEVLPLKAGDKIVSMLPMAHMYGLAFEFLYEFAVGCHIFFLTRMPSPKIIFQAFTEVKPNLIVAVPLIIEKIIKKSVLPKLETPAMKLLLKVPIINDKIKATVREQMIQAFGGNFAEIIVGGAAFNQEVEQFLKMIDFPYTVGYGMTECGPIICYEDWTRFKPGSCGKAAPRMEVKILSSDPENIPGEIVCRGPNVMLGYYKNDEATVQVLDKDGWLHTGDLALMDAEGNVSIKGRSKNMLLGPSGQNIYPEEIEDKLNNMPYVAESIIVQQNEKLVGLVYPDFDDAFAHGLNNDDIERVMEENRVALNAELPAYSQIFKMKIYPEEFEKTPKKSIKRFLYQEAKG